MSPRPKKNQQQANLVEAIKEIAWKQIAESGAPTLSLRGIARELGITAPAIYNYYPNRDALVAALILDAFTSLGESQKESIRGLPPYYYLRKLSTLGLAYREWAITYPQRYQLIFGTPIPGYHAPEDTTLPAAAYALSPLIETLQDIFLAGKLPSKNFPRRTDELTSMLEAWSQFAGGQDPEVLYAALVIWSRVHGLVMLEISNQMPAFITDPGEVFRREIETIKNHYVS
jgi:AcrR family transcriptional regulator